MNKTYFFAVLIFVSCSSESGISNETDDSNETKSVEFDNGNQTNVSSPLYTTNGKFTPGIFTDSGYVNRYFQFQVEIGSEWEILDKLEQERALDVSTGELTEKDEKFEHDIDISKANWSEILTLRKNNWIPWINFMAEKLEPIPGVENAMEYLEYTKNYIITNDPAKTSFPIYTDGSISSDSISGREFLIQNFTIEDEDGIYYQTTYSAQFDEYLLNIITNYENDDQKAEITSFLNTIKWMQ